MNSSDVNIIVARLFVVYMYISTCRLQVPAALRVDVTMRMRGQLSPCGRHGNGQATIRGTLQPPIAARRVTALVWLNPLPCRIALPEASLIQLDAYATPAAFSHVNNSNISSPQWPLSVSSIPQRLHYPLGRVHVAHG